LHRCLQRTDGAKRRVRDPVVVEIFRRVFRLVAVFTFRTVAVG